MCVSDNQAKENSFSTFFDLLGKVLHAARILNSNKMFKKNTALWANVNDNLQFLFCLFIWHSFSFKLFFPKQGVGNRVIGKKSQNTRFYLFHAKAPFKTLHAKPAVWQHFFLVAMQCIFRFCMSLLFA